jgi:methionine synthase II (cobalamin-independent)
MRQKKEKITYTKTQVDSISEKLKKMPEISVEKTFCRRDVVKVLAKEIIELKKRGYTIEQIAETLRGEGFDIATPTLKNYLRPKKRKQKEHTSQTPKTTQKHHDGNTQEKSKSPSSNASEHTSTDEKSKGTFIPKADTENI